MKWLFFIFISVVVIIGAGIGLSIFAHESYSDSVARARDNGLQDGTTAGYYDGKRDGGEDGYQEINRTLFLETDAAESLTENISSYYFLYNPTFSEVIEFFGSENFPSFDAFHDAILSKGIRSGYVRCYVSYGSSDEVTSVELAAFETVDNGFVIIDPRSGEQVIAVEGDLYHNADEDPDPEIHPLITRMLIVW